MSAESTPATLDPYAPKPPLWAGRSDYLWAGVVFVATIALVLLSFPPSRAADFAYAMLVPGIFWAYRAPDWKLYLGTMAAAQAVAWTILLGWVHHVTWLGLLLLGPFIGVWVGLWYAVARWALPRVIGRTALTRIMVMVALAGSWVVIEWTRTWLLSGFPWLTLSISQWQRSSILQIAAFTGAGGVSFVLVAMNLGFSAMAHSLFCEGQGGWNFRRPEFLFALFLLMACVSVHVRESFNRGLFTVPLARVAFVQPYIPQEVKWNPERGPAILDVLRKTTLAAGSTNPDLILWPESSTPYAVKGDAGAQAFVESLAQQSRAPLLIGSIGVEHRGAADEAWYNAAFVVDPVAGVQTDYYAKRHLVPFGEYVPLRPLLGWLKKIVPVGDDDFSRGPDSAPLIISQRSGSPLTVGTLICYEDIFPDLARSSARVSDFLAVLTNNAWYGEGGAAEQHAAHSVLRAVETRRPVLRCGNGGWSGWIDEFGNIRATVLNKEGSVYFRGTQTVNVTRDARWIGRESFYVQHGDWFILVCTAAALLGFGALQAAGPVRPREDSAA